MLTFSLNKSERFEGIRLLEVFTEIIAYLFFIVTLPLSLCFCLKVIPDYQRAVVFRNGRLKRQNPMGPGIVLVLPFIDAVFTVDLRCLVIDILPQEILTKDSVTIYVNGVLYFHINNPIRAVTQVEHFYRSIELLAQTTLRNSVGNLDLQSLITQKEDISEQITNLIDVSTEKWGVTIERVEIQDIKLPQSLQRSMAAEAEADREAKAKMIAAEGEYKASLKLKEASDVLAQSPTSVQLRYLQTLNTISAEKRTTIVFPFPMDMSV